MFPFSALEIIVMVLSPAFKLSLPLIVIFAVSSSGVIFMFNVFLLDVMNKSFILLSLNLYSFPSIVIFFMLLLVNKLIFFTNELLYVIIFKYFDAFFIVDVLNAF